MSGTQAGMSVSIEEYNTKVQFCSTSTSGLDIHFLVVTIQVLTGAVSTWPPDLICVISVIGRLLAVIH